MRILIDKIHFVAFSVNLHFIHFVVLLVFFAFFFKFNNMHFSFFAVIKTQALAYLFILDVINQLLRITS